MASHSHDAPLNWYGSLLKGFNVLSRLQCCAPRILCLRLLWFSSVLCVLCSNRIWRWLETFFFKHTVSPVLNFQKQGMFARLESDCMAVSFSRIELIRAWSLSNWFNISLYYQHLRLYKDTENNRQANSNQKGKKKSWTANSKIQKQETLPKIKS